MTTEDITISKQSLLKAYREAEPSQREFMKKLFGTEAFTINFNVMERVKTFEDAVQELGEDNPLVKEYDLISNMRPTSDLLAFLKLRIIVAALNEGWEPQYTEDEYRWYPWFYLYTKKEYDKMDDEDKHRCVLRSGFSSYANSGLAYADAGYASSYSYTDFGGRLALRSQELADYAGRQFRELYADYFLFK